VGLVLGDNEARRDGEVSRIEPGLLAHFARDTRCDVDPAPPIDIAIVDETTGQIGEAGIDIAGNRQDRRAVVP